MKDFCLAKIYDVSFDKDKCIATRKKEKKDD